MRLRTLQRPALLLAMSLAASCFDGVPDPSGLSDAALGSDVPAAPADTGCPLRSCAQLQAQCGLDDYGTACGTFGDFGAAGECPVRNDLRCGGQFRCVPPPPSRPAHALADGSTTEMSVGARTPVMFTLPQDGHVDLTAYTEGNDAGQFSTAIVTLAQWGAVSEQGCAIHGWAFGQARAYEYDKGRYRPTVQRWIDDMAAATYVLILTCSAASSAPCTIRYHLTATY